MSDYQKLLLKYKELKEEKADVLELKKELEKVKNELRILHRINKKITKENIELSYLVTELLRGKK